MGKAQVKKPPKRTAPKYAIVNDIDQPCKRLICELIDGLYYYMGRVQDPSLKRFDGMNPEAPTGLEEFGFIIEETGDRVQFDLPDIAFVSATYPDGKSRKWQDSFRLSFSLPRVVLTRTDKRKVKARLKENG